MANIAEVVLTEVIKSALRKSSESESIDKASKVEFEKALGSDSRPNETIAFKTVRNLANVLSKTGEKVYIHDLLKGSDVHLTTIEPAKRSAELELRLDQLRAQQENKEYDRMVGNVRPKKENQLDFNIGADIKALNRQMTAVFNFVITVVAAFAFGYKGSDLLLGVSNVAEKLTYGLFLGMMVFFADLYFLVKHTNKE